MSYLLSLPPGTEERFWAKVNRSGPVHPDLGTACWLWVAGVSKNRGSGRGYGKFRVTSLSHGGKIVKAHRFALALDTKEDPAEMDACHRCDTPLCCNPEHLFWGTHRENMRDFIAKYGRVATAKRPLPPRPQLPFEGPPADEAEAAARAVLGLDTVPF